LRDVGSHVTAPEMIPPRPQAGALPPKLKRTLELTYAVEGVLSARVWQWPGCVAVGVRGNCAASPTELLRRVEIAVAGLRNPDERWEFGILDDEAPLRQPSRA
jgi:hypothetical protein